jgi:hypothetical protein
LKGKAVREFFLGRVLVAYRADWDGTKRLWGGGGFLRIFLNRGGRWQLLLEGGRGDTRGPAGFSRSGVSKSRRHGRRDVRGCRGAEGDERGFGGILWRRVNHRGDRRWQLLLGDVIDERCCFWTGETGGKWFGHRTGHGRRSRCHGARSAWGWKIVLRKDIL